MNSTAPKIKGITWFVPKNILLTGIMLSNFFFYFLISPSSMKILLGILVYSPFFRTSSPTNIPEVTLYGFINKFTTPLPNVA